MENYDTIGYRGFDINIEYDLAPMDPRTDWDNAGKMICFHPRYGLGDDHAYSDPDDFLDDLLYEVDERYATIYEILEDNENYKLAEKFRQDIIERHYYILPLYLYDHSGISISTSTFSCPWDSGQVGYIYISKEDAKKEWSDHEKMAIELLEEEVKTYDNFLTGQVYGYTVESAARNKIKCDDSCFGYYGDAGIEQAIAEAKQSIDYEIAQYKKEVVRDHRQKLVIKKFMRECWAV